MVKGAIAEVKVKSIEWLSKDAEEALLCITDGVYECLVYDQPCDLNVGSLVYEPLETLDACGAVRVNESKIGFSKMRGYFDYDITAEVVDTNAEIVKVGNILIDIQYSLPGDIHQGDIVNFTCNRLVFMG
ncbi:MAG: hypothetical protein AAGA60_02615 [Cyanobacteria bacterium P01_E01_bin.42]